MLGWLLGAAVIVVIGAVDVVRRRIGPASAGIAVVAYALPVVLVFAAVEASPAPAVSRGRAVAFQRRAARGGRERP